MFFTTPDLLEIGKLPFVTPYKKPTRHEALRYYRQASSTRTGSTSRSARKSIASEREEVEGETIFVVDSRSAAGCGAAAARGSRDRDRLLRSPEHGRHPRRRPAARTALLRRPARSLPTERRGGGRKNSAAKASLEMYRAGAQVTLVHRARDAVRPDQYWVRPDIDNRIKEGSIAAHFESRVLEIRPTSVLRRVPAAVFNSMCLPTRSCC